MVKPSACILQACRIIPPQNIIFNALSKKSHCDRHVGCLSIKTLWGKGEEWYAVALLTGALS